MSNQQERQTPQSRARSLEELDKALDEYYEAKGLDDSLHDDMHDQDTVAKRNEEDAPLSGVESAVAAGTSGASVSEESIRLDEFDREFHGNGFTLIKRDLGGGKSTIVATVNTEQGFKAMTDYLLEHNLRLNNGRFQPMTLFRVVGRPTYGDSNATTEGDVQSALQQHEHDHEHKQHETRARSHEEMDRELDEYWKK